MARFTFLGTGSINNTERASISFALDMGSEGVLLVDTSSGREVLQRLQQARIDSSRIRAIYVTHQHGDHSGGLGLLLLRLLEQNVPSITIWTPNESTEPLKSSVDILYPGILSGLGERLNWQPAFPNQQITLGSLSIQPFATIHPVPVLGCRILANGRTIVYAADTAPSENVIAAANDADILIHEASGYAAEGENAHLFGHSTSADAGRTAAAANVKHLYLVHHPAHTPEQVEQLRREAQQHYSGPVTVPNDLDSFEVGAGE